MKKSTLILLLFVYFSAWSQNDSARLDAGGVVLKRAFTQNVTIKGEDLEKMPFTTLSEAIGTWLYGTYTNPAYITYVVDGNILSDVNSYSIHDIEEVVLVQNAAAQTHTGSTQRLMVLITTRKGKDRQGIQGAAQTFVVHYPGSTTNLFHQYYVSGYKNLEKISVGFSANYLRDVTPRLKYPYYAATPTHLDRWRLNGYFIWRPDSRNTVEAHIGFVPQSAGAQGTYLANQQGDPSYAYRTHVSTDLLLPWLRWHGEWAPGLKNDLQLGLVSQLQKGSSREKYYGFDSLGDIQYNLTDQVTHTDHQYIRDHISYEIKAGSWLVTPSLNASYEHFKDNFVQTNFYTLGQETHTFNPPANGLNTGSGMSQYGPFKTNQFLLTPAMDFTYKQVLDIQGGAVVNVSHAEKGQKVAKRVFPFASVALELLRTNGDGRHNSLKLFGSYAQRDAFIFDDYSLGDLSSSTLYYVTNLVPVEFYSGTTPIIPPMAYTPVKNYWTWQTGASFASRDKRWQASYHFERQNFTTSGTQTTPTGVYLLYSEWKSSLHFVELRGRILDGTAFGWQSGITATLIRSTTGKYGDSYFPTPLGSYFQGNDKPSWTGGWTNRLRYKDFSLGADLLYHFNRESLFILPSGDRSYSTFNEFQLQNVFLAYQVHLRGKTGLEVYVDSRDLSTNDKYHYLDSRRFYGVGGKITI